MRWVAVRGLHASGHFITFIVTVTVTVIATVTPPPLSKTKSCYAQLVFVLKFVHCLGQVEVHCCPEFRNAAVSSAPLSRVLYFSDRTTLCQVPLLGFEGHHGAILLVEPLMCLITSRVGSGRTIHDVRVGCGPGATAT